MFIRTLIVLIASLTLLESRSYAETEPSLPFEEKFSDFLKGSWRGRNGVKEWSSGPLRVEGVAEAVVSFDVNQRGSVQVGESPEEQYLEITYRLDGKGEGDPLFLKAGSFKGEVVRRQIPIGQARTLEVRVKAVSSSKSMQYYVDNVRVEDPAEGAVIAPFALAPYSPPPPPAVAPVDSGVVPYATTPRYKPSATYSLSVNEVPILVEESWGDLGVTLDPTARDYRLAVARFAFDFQQNPTAKIRIQVDEPIGQYTISPQNSTTFGVAGDDVYANVRNEDTALYFEVDAPRQLLLEINELEYLVLLIDPIESNPPKVGSEDVINLAEYLERDRDRNEDVTVQVQRALDDASAAQATLFVPDDLYMTGQLAIRSNTHLYLSSGAMIQAIPEWNRDLWPAQAGANVTNKDSSFIFVGDNSVSMDRLDETKIENVRISGRGVIDGNGWNMRYYNDSSLEVANVKLFRSANVRNLVVEGIYFRDSARWSFNVLLTEGVRFTNVKLINCMVGYWGDWENSKHFPGEEGAANTLFHIPLVTNLDGFDIDAVSNGVFENSFVFTGDDAFTPKVTAYMDLVGPCRNLLIRNNVIWTEKVALKVGPEDYDDMYNIVFSDNSVIRADRLFTVLVHGKDGVSSSNIQVLNNRVETIGGNFYERFFRFDIAHPGSISNIEIDGLRALEMPPQFSSSSGFDANNSVRDVSIENIWVDSQRLEYEDLFLKDENEGSYPDIRFSDIKVNGVLYESLGE